jgi:hypothetical protein
LNSATEIYISFTANTGPTNIWSDYFFKLVYGGFCCHLTVSNPNSEDQYLVFDFDNTSSTYESADGYLKFVASTTWANPLIDDPTFTTYSDRTDICLSFDFFRCPSSTPGSSGTSGTSGTSGRCGQENNPTYGPLYSSGYYRQYVGTGDTTSSSYPPQGVAVAGGGTLSSADGVGAMSGFGPNITTSYPLCTIGSPNNTSFYISRYDLEGFDLLDMIQTLAYGSILYVSCQDDFNNWIPDYYFYVQVLSPAVLIGPDEGNDVYGFIGIILDDPNYTSNPNTAGICNIWSKLGVRFCVSLVQLDYTPGGAAYKNLPTGDGYRSTISGFTTSPTPSTSGETYYNNSRVNEVTQIKLYKTDNLGVDFSDTFTGGTITSLKISYNNFEVERIVTGVTQSGDVYTFNLSKATSDGFKSLSSSTKNNLFITGQTALINFTVIQGYTGGSVTYDSSGTLLIQNQDSTKDIRITGFTEITGGTYTSGSTTLTLTNNLGENINITGFSSGTTISVSANTGLGLTNNTLFTTYNTLLDGSLAMTSTVGGLSSGTLVSALTGKTLVGLFDDILFPTVLPTYTIPTITRNGTSSNTYEVGTTTSISITAKGVKNDAGNFTQIQLLRNSSLYSTETSFTTNAESNISNFTYTNPNSPNSGFTTSAYTESLTVPAPTSSTQSSTTYQYRGQYSAGLPKYNNKGSLDTRPFAERSTSNPQSAESGTDFTSGTLTINGVYPFWYGKSVTQPTVQTIKDAISGGTATKSSITNSQDGTLTITFGASGEYIWFAHFSGYTTKISYYVSDFNKENFGPSNLINTFVTGSVTSPSGFWSDVNYKIYISTRQTTTTSFGAMQMRTTSA